MHQGPPKPPLQQHTCMVQMHNRSLSSRNNKTAKNTKPNLAEAYLHKKPNQDAKRESGVFISFTCIQHNLGTSGPGHLFDTSFTEDYHIKPRPPCKIFCK